MNFWLLYFASSFMGGNLLKNERSQICAGSRLLRLLAWPYDGVVVCRYELVPRRQIVRINLNLFYLLAVLAPCLIVVFGL